MKTTILSTLTLATALTVGSIGSAQAAILGGITFGGPAAGTSYTGTNLSEATSFTFGAPVFNTGSNGDYTSVTFFSTNSLAPSNTISTPGSSVTLPFSMAFSSSTTPANRFTFTATSGTTVRGSNPNSIDFIFDGGIVDSTGVLTANSASAIISATQAGGPGNNISYSGTLVSPSQFAVPEPITMTGAALALGLGGLIKRKTRSSK